MKKILAVLALLVFAATLYAIGPAFPYSVALGWTDSTTPNTTGQNVYRAPYASGSCGTYAVLTAGANIAPTLTTFTDTTVVPGASYCYATSALEGTAESALAISSSNPVLIPPAPQTGVTAVVQ
jgi:hypothetical protein